MTAHHEHDDHGHDHGLPVTTAAEVSARRERRLRSVLVLNLVIVLGEAVAGFASSSIGLLADAAHNLVDVGGVALALVAVRWARRAPTSRQSFGFHRGTVLAAQANAATILGTTLLVLWESVRRLLDPEPVDGGVVLVVATIAFLANTGSVIVLRDPGHDLNMRAAVLHMAADAAASFGVAIAGLVILTTGRYDRLDPLVSILIAVLIGWQGWRLLRASGEVLLESTPAGVDLDELAATIRAVEGVDDVHDLHVWSLSSEVRALSAHLIVGGEPSLDEAQAVGTRVKATISGPFRIAHATLELESARCVDDGTWCTITGLDVAPSSHAGHGH